MPCAFSKRLRNHSERLRNPERASRANSTYKADQDQGMGPPHLLRRCCARRRRFAAAASQLSTSKLGRLPSPGCVSLSPACTASRREARRECQGSHTKEREQYRHPVRDTPSAVTWRNSASLWNQAPRIRCGGMAGNLPSRRDGLDAALAIHLALYCAAAACFGLGFYLLPRRRS